MTDLPLLALLLLSAVSFFWLLFKGGFELKKSQLLQVAPRVQFYHVLAAALLWILGQFFIIDILEALDLENALQMNYRQWFCFADFFSTLIIIACLLLFQATLKLDIIGKKIHFFLGVVYGIAMQFPALILIVVLQWIVELFGDFFRGDQLCQSLLEECSTAAWLYWMTFATFGILCPIVEEILFRGFLQNWLVGKARAWVAIFITSTVFMLVHYSSSQGATNVDILATVFMLSVVFGMLYQRTRTLTAPIGMHITNNVIALLFQDFC